MTDNRDPTPEEQAQENWKLAKGEAKFQMALAKVQACGDVDVAMRRMFMMRSADEDLEFFIDRESKISLLEAWGEAYLARFPNLDADALKDKLIDHLRKRKAASEKIEAEVRAERPDLDDYAVTNEVARRMPDIMDMDIS